MLLFGTDAKRSVCSIMKLENKECTHLLHFEISLVVSFQLCILADTLLLEN